MFIIFRSALVTKIYSLSDLKQLKFSMCFLEWKKSQRIINCLVNIAILENQNDYGSIDSLLSPIAHFPLLPSNNNLNSQLGTLSPTKRQYFLVVTLGITWDHVTKFQPMRKCYVKLLGSALRGQAHPLLVLLSFLPIITLT